MNQRKDYLMNTDETQALIAEARQEESIHDKLGDGFGEDSEERAFYYEHRDRYKRLADALAALATPQEEKSAAKVVTVSYEASASCSHGTCPAGCSHLMWACTACSCEGGWGASRERLEELAAKHECPPAPQEEDTREFVADRVARALDGNGGDDLGEAAGEGALHLALASPIREAIEDVYADCGDSDPRVLSTNIAQRLAYLLPPAILAAFPVLSRAAAPEEVEWEYQCNRGGLYGMNVPVDDPEQHRFVCNEPRLERRRKAGPWEAVPHDNSDPR